MNALKLFFAYQASLWLAIGTVIAVLGKRRTRVLIDWLRRDGMHILLSGAGAILILWITISGAFLGILNLAFDLGKYPDWYLITSVGENTAIALLLLPWARYVLVDVPMAEAWWNTTWHRTAVIGIFGLDAALSLVVRNYSGVMANLLAVAIWWWNPGGGGGGWNDVPTGVPDPAGSKSK